MRSEQTGANEAAAPIYGPEPGYREALNRFASFSALDRSDINPVCRSRLLTHGAPAPRALILIHGLTNCPHQFDQLGDLFFQRGYNVLIPRMPRHGLVDRLTTDMANLKTGELKNFADRIVDIGRGLGRELYVAGFSAGGAVASHIAQYRPEADRCILISPALGIAGLGPTINRFLRTFFAILPNMFVWADPKMRQKWDGPNHQYLKQSSRGLSAVLDLAAGVMQKAAATPPAAHSLLVITNANDRVVDNKSTRKLALAWERNSRKKVDAYEFPAGLNLMHDLISPDRPGQKTDQVYPILLDLIDR